MLRLEFQFSLQASVLAKVLGKSMVSVVWAAVRVPTIGA